MKKYKNQLMRLLLVMLSIFVLASCGEKTSSTSGAEIDLTKGSGHIINRKVFDILSYPNENVGKRVKAKGIFFKGYSINPQYDFDIILIEDALACCAEGFEFKLDEKILKTGYKLPLEEKNIEVEGTLELYIGEDKMEYLYIKVDKIKNL